jgi:GNAT superfamily N-acetyltransferase
MADLRIVRADDEARLRDWRHVHNTIIPTHVLSVEDVRERSGRHLLDVAYADGELVGCMTVRPPDGEDRTVTVIARVLAEHRRRGYGTALYEQGMAQARGLGAGAVETVVLESNAEGLHFALAQGFVEVERYLLDGDTIPYVTLRRP